jgi:hypothetical protein
VKPPAYRDSVRGRPSCCASAEQNGELSTALPCIFYGEARVNLCTVLTTGVLLVPPHTLTLLSRGYAASLKGMVCETRTCIAQVPDAVTHITLARLWAIISTHQSPGSTLLLTG